MLQRAPKLKSLRCYKLWISSLSLASNELEVLDLHRSDSLGTLTLWAPNLRHLGLQGCFNVSNG